jgi:uncharacterized protein (DUF302 family)
MAEKNFAGVARGCGRLCVLSFYRLRERHVPSHEQSVYHNGIWKHHRRAVDSAKHESRKGAAVKYGISKTTNLPFGKAIEKATEELKKEGFGVLTTIDVKETMKKKLNTDFSNYTILGACNPPFAYQALQAEEEIGLLLPCNVLVYEKEGKTNVAAFDPLTMTAIVDNPGLEPVAREVRARLERVIAAL